MLTIEDLFAQPDNAAVLRYLDGSPFDEGGQIFFHDYGRRIPHAARCRLDLVNLLVHERTARIFALHEGRFTIALRRDTTPFDGDFVDNLRGYTADGSVDLSALGPGWVLFDWTGNEEEEVWLAYELAGR